LRIYKFAFESSMRIFQFSKTWPPEERYSLTDQIRRSSRSVCENLAEAWRKRRYPSHFISKLTDADAEAAETEVWLDFALECGYLPKEAHEELTRNYETICGGLVKMINDAPQWCGPANQVKEDEPEYMIGC